MWNRRAVLLAIHLMSLILLGLGWFLDVLTVRVSVSMAFFGVSMMDETRSVMTTLEKLWETSNYFPFFLILLFGIIVPIAKTYLLFRVILFPARAEEITKKYIDPISKWAMADVFAVAILVSFFAANALDYTTAILREGFYYFAGYVLLSNILVMLIRQRYPLQWRK